MARGRKAQVTYWASKGGFGFNYNGKPYIFKGEDDYPDGPCYKSAVLALAKLQCQQTDKGSDDYLVSAVLNTYRAHLIDTGKRNAERFEWMGASFAERFGTLKTADVKPYHLTEWLAENVERWGDTTRRIAGQAILSAFGFAKRRGYISSDPLNGRLESDDLPTARVRGEEARMSSELCDLLISAAESNPRPSPLFADFLRICRETGCRPGELRKAHAYHYVNGRIIYRWNATDGITHKTARKTKRDRVIYLTPAAQAIIEKLIAKRPNGPLFTTARSPKGWTEEAVNYRFRRLRKRPAVASYCAAHNINLDDVRPYNFRHTWISEYLERTGDYYGCAQFCGTSVQMLERRYGHPDSRKMHERYLAYMGQEAARPVAGKIGA